MSWLRDFGNWAAANASFTLTFMAISGVMLLAVAKDADVNTLLPTLLGLFLAQKGGTSISAHWAAAKDDKSSAAEVIRDVEGLAKPPTQ
jgi:uncharacterized membrane protein YfcA